MGWRKKEPETPLQAIERREARVRDVLDWLEGKEALKALGLTIDHLRAFTAAREELGAEPLRRVARLAKSMEMKHVEGLAELLESGLSLKEIRSLRKLHQGLRETGLATEEMAEFLDAARSLRRLGFDRAAARGLAREFGRLREEGKDPQEAVRALAGYVEHQVEAQEALVAAIGQQKAKEVELSEMEKEMARLQGEFQVLSGEVERERAAREVLRKEVETLQRQRALLQAEVSGLGRARAAPWLQTQSRLLQGLALLEKKMEESRQVIERHRGAHELLRAQYQKESERLRRVKEEMEAALKPEEAPAGPPAPPAGPGAATFPPTRAYRRIQDRLRQAALGGRAPLVPREEAAAAGPEEKEPESPAAEIPPLAPLDLSQAEAATREIAEAMALLRSQLNEMERYGEMLERQVRQKESVLRQSDALWALLAGRSDADLLAAAEALARGAREGKPADPGRLPPEMSRKLQEAARRLLQAEMVDAAKFRELEEEVREMRGRMEAMVPRTRLESLLRENESLRRQLAEAVPRWQAEAQEEQLRFLKKVAFEKPEG